MIEPIPTLRNHRNTYLVWDTLLSGFDDDEIIDSGRTFFIDSDEITYHIELFGSSSQTGTLEYRYAIRVHDDEGNIIGYL